MKRDALERADVGLLAGQPGAELDLVGEVHQPEVALEPPVGLDQPEQLGAPVDRVDRLLDRLAVGGAVLAGDLLGQRPLEPGRASASRARTSAGATRCSLIALSRASRFWIAVAGWSVRCRTSPVNRSTARAPSW